MKKLFLIFLLFFSIVNTTYAIPVATLVIWYDFLIVLIPTIFWFFSIIYFYFRKNIFYINIFLVITSIFLYFFHFHITKEYFIFDYEYGLFFIIIVFLWLIYKYIYLYFINYIIVLWLIIMNIFFIKIDYNLYELKQIYLEVEKNMYSNIVINKVIYKDNFMAIYSFDTETKVSAYTVIWIWDEVKHCIQKWKYNICNWWNSFLSKWISSLVYEAIK